jgi:Glycosyl hydrolase family 12
VALAAASGAILAGAAAVLTAGSAQAATPLSGMQSTPVAGGAYTVQNNEWGTLAPESITTDGNADFTVANSSISSVLAGYTSIYAGCHWGDCTRGGLAANPVRVSTLTNPGTVTTSWSITQPAGSTSYVYNAAYDRWLNQTPATTGQPNGAELMVWLNYRGPVHPFGTSARWRRTRSAAAISGRRGTSLTSRLASNCGGAAPAWLPTPSPSI